ncbi:transposase [Micromonospora sp. b486]|uniref:transposase n=1 Tax=unclassified Micromonospora TaxID=2617518 RepID=UPI001C21CB3C|nr:transposase [Micromonospora sp. WMMB482]
MGTLRLDLVRSSQRPINQVARELGMSHEPLRNWVRGAERRTGAAATAAGGDGLSVADKVVEIARARWR